ncbi:NINE protein [Viridibacterium curvum]|uniref:TM2 domain-containing protein n=1 Tax=Viridibacterium curvum TaxID=1101404 RepID=A0ABP9QUZ5_9RHOO
MSGNVYAAPKASLERLTKDCSECGAEINKKAVICPKCGVKQKGQVSKVALVLLTFFAGGLGAHKFYLKKPWWGLLYLLFFWTWIPGLVAFIEFIIYLCTSEESLNEKYEAGNSGVIIAIVVAIFGGIALIGILAAIALPQYQNYTMKARTMAAIQSIEPLRQEVQQFIVKNGRLPQTPEEVTADNVRELPNLGTARLQENGRIVILFGNAASSLRDQTIEFEPRIANNQLSWDCTGGSVKPIYRPQQCQRR